MYETIKWQFESGKALTQSKNYQLTRRDLWPAFYHEMYPINQEYYHELNPYFTFNIHRRDLFSFAKTFFVRDGKANFASFILNNMRQIPKFETHFLIHRDLAPIVPPNLTEYFSCWEMVQPKKIPIEKAKKVVIFGLLCDQYLGSVEVFAKKLQKLTKLPPEIEIEIYLPLRRNPLDQEHPENVFQYIVIEKIKELAKDLKIKFLITPDFMERPSFKDCYFIDLATDHYLISDNYTHYHVASRGGTVDNMASRAPADSFFKFALSLHHEVHLTPFPKTESIFVELLFAKKKSHSPQTFQDANINALLGYKQP